MRCNLKWQPCITHVYHFCQIACLYICRVCLRSRLILQGAKATLRNRQDRGGPADVDVSLFILWACSILVILVASILFMLCCLRPGEFAWQNLICCWQNPNVIIWGHIYFNQAKRAALSNVRHDTNVCMHLVKWVAYSRCVGITTTFPRSFFIVGKALGTTGTSHKFLQECVWNSVISGYFVWFKSKYGLHII